MVKVQLLDCGKCVVCCQKDNIFLHPELGDNPDDYLTEIYENRYVLQIKKNDDCIYLDRAKGCTNYENRPAICKELDCRRFIKEAKKNPKLLSHGILSPELLAAAKAAKKRNKNQRINKNG